MISPQHTQLHPQRRVPRLVGALLALVALLLGACAGDGAEDIQAVAEGEAADAADYPEWIEKLYPPPGSETAINQAVQVNHTAVGPNQQVRLTIDGVDVTAYAVDTSPGLLEYDIDQANAPVDLAPGEHEAVVELLRVTPSVSEGVDSYDPDVHEVVDSYRWSFTVL